MTFNDQTELEFRAATARRTLELIARGGTMSGPPTRVREVRRMAKQALERIDLSERV